MRSEQEDGGRPSRPLTRNLVAFLKRPPAWVQRERDDERPAASSPPVSPPLMDGRCPAADSDPHPDMLMHGAFSATAERLVACA